MADKQTHETELTFDQVKEQLTESGKKRGVLTYEEIAERMSSFEIESDQMDEYYEFLGEQGVELISENEETEDPNIQRLAKAEEEFDLNDLSVPPGVKINDPVRMYLKEIGRVNLLSAKKKSPTLKRLKKVTKNLNADWLKRTCGLLSVSQNGMSDAVCCSLI